MTQQIFEAALGIQSPWYISDVDLDTNSQVLTIKIDFERGFRFAVDGATGEYTAHDTVRKQYRHLNFFQHECYLDVRIPKVKLPDGKIRQVTPEWVGKLSGFTLLFEALVMALTQQMPFRAVARLVNVSVHRVMSICERYVDQALAQTDFSGVTRLAIDETSRAKGHDYVTLAADMDRRAVVFVTEGRDAAAIHRLAEDLKEHNADPLAIESVSIDMSPAFKKGCGEALPNARITFDKFHVIAHASKAVDQMRRIEQKSDPSLKGLRWTLLKHRDGLSSKQQVELDSLISRMTSKRTARAWVYKEQLSELLNCKQINVLRASLNQWCTNVMRSKVVPMKEVARMVRNNFEGIVAWAQTRQTNGFIEAVNGLFQASKRKARGYVRFKTIKMVIFLIAGKLNYGGVNPHMQNQPT